MHTFRRDHEARPGVTGINRRQVSALALLGALAACAGPGSGLPRLPEEARSAYKLGPEDQLRISVFNDPRLTGEFRISDSGTLALPLVGTVRAAGLTTEELERAIEREMARKNLFRDPSVSAQVIKYRPVFVLGMVERGGEFPYQPGMTALTAVALAGGFNYRAIPDYVSITRIDAEGKPVEYRAPPSALPQPGDVVRAFERRF